MPLSWHETVIVNWAASVERKCKELDQCQREFDAMRIRLDFYTRQIERAKRLGKDGFDREKFMQKHKDSQ